MILRLLAVAGLFLLLFGFLGRLMKKSSPEGRQDGAIDLTQCPHCGAYGTAGVDGPCETCGKKP